MTTDDATIFDSIVTEEFATKRIDQYLAQIHNEYSRTRWAQLILDGYVQLNYEPCTKLSTKMRMGDVLSAAPPPAEVHTLEPENIPLEVLFEDAHLIVINKPIGLVVHPAPGHWSGTLVNALLHHCGDSLSGIGGVKRPGIVHRLDKDTSGVMVAAKSDKAHEGLSAQFAAHGRDGKLEREYLALCIGQPARDSGTVHEAIGRDPRNRLKMAVGGASPRDAITHWRCETHFGTYASQLRCTLETGRTHQIRVHMAHIGLPIIGDPLYGHSVRTKLNIWPEPAKSVAQAFTHQALHAAVLGFQHPLTGESLRFETSAPEDFTLLKNIFST